MQNPANIWDDAPLNAYRVASTVNPDEAIDIISHTYCGREARLITAVDALRFRFCEARLGRTTLGAMSFDSDVHYDLGETESCFLIQLADRGTIEYVNGGETCEVTPTQGMVTSPTRPLRIHYGKRSRGFIFKIDRRTLENHFRTLTGATLSRPLIFGASIPDRSSFALRYGRLLRYLVGELDADGGILSMPRYIANIEDLVMTALLTGQRHNFSHCLKTPPPSTTPALIRRVEEYVLADPARPCSIADFVSLTGVSGRSLYRAFRRYRGCTPMSFVRTARLNMARIQLTAGTPGATVTSIALNCGFEHLGRFAHDYAAHYGEPPSQTLKTARHPAPPPN